MNCGRKPERCRGRARRRREDIRQRYTDFVRFVPSSIVLPSLSHDVTNRGSDDPSSNGEMVASEGVSVRNTNDGLSGSTGFPPRGTLESSVEHERGGLAVAEKVDEVLCDDAFTIVDGEEPKEIFVIEDIADI
jgi:hypothetical protein